MFYPSLFLLKDQTAEIGQGMQMGFFHGQKTLGDEIVPGSYVVICDFNVPQKIKIKLDSCGEQIEYLVPYAVKRFYWSWRWIMCSLKFSRGDCSSSFFFPNVLL